MARKKQAPAGPNNGYLISFGDTMTALLAFFIVLNSLASEQTGAALYSGTGSFVEVGDSGGVPGLFTQDQSRYAVGMTQPSPLYIVTDDKDPDPDTAARGPDSDGDSSTIRDRDQDNLQRFLIEMENNHHARDEKVIIGEVALDRMTPLSASGDLLDEAMQQQLLRFVPVLRREGYELEIRVWATTPAPSAWERAANQANTIRDEAVRFLGLRSEQSAHVTASASPWHSPTIKRPTMSFLLRRVE